MKKIVTLVVALMMLATLALPSFAAGTTVDLENGLMAHYTFDEYDAATETYADSSKTNPAAVELMYGAAYQSVGAVGNCAYFDGETTLMAYDDAVGDKMMNMTEMTFSVWLYPEMVPAEKSDGNRYFFCTHTWEVSDLHLQFVWGDYPGSIQYCLKGNSKQPTGGQFESLGVSYYRTPQVEAKKWTLITLVYSNTANTLKYYVNGEYVETATYSESVPISLPAICIGNHCSIGKYNGYQGYLDDLRIYNRELNDLEIMALAQMGADIEPSAEAVTAAATETTEAPATTEAPVTDAPETNAPETDAPETNAPETNAPETNAPENTDAGKTTDAPETTKAPDTTSSGCGSSVAYIAVAVTAMLGTAVVFKKKK